MKTYKQLKNNNLILFVSQRHFKKNLNELEENEEIEAMTQTRSGASNIFITNKRIMIRKNPMWFGMGDNLDIAYSDIEKNSVDNTVFDNLRFNVKGLQYVIWDEKFRFQNLLKELIAEDEKRRKKVKQVEEKIRKMKYDGYNVEELEEKIGELKWNEEGFKSNDIGHKMKGTQMEKKYKSLFNELKGSLKAVLLDENNNELKKISISELTDEIKKGDKTAAIVIDGIITQRLLDVANSKKIDVIVGHKIGNITKYPASVKILTKDDLE